MPWQYIFRERKDLISVFLSGNLEARIKDIQEEQGLSYDDGIKRINALKWLMGEV